MTFDMKISTVHLTYCQALFFVLYSLNQDAIEKESFHPRNPKLPDEAKRGDVERIFKIATDTVGMFLNC